MSKILVLIPSRLSATRLKRKPLLKIDNLSLINHVYRNAVKAKIGDVYVVTGDKALLDYEKQWNFEELNGFLLKPATWIKGNKMGFAGLKDDKDRASVILYLNDSSDVQLPLP